LTRCSPPRAAASGGTGERPLLRARARARLRLRLRLRARVRVRVRVG